MTRPIRGPTKQNRTEINTPPCTNSSKYNLLGLGNHHHVTLVDLQFSFNARTHHQS